MKRAIAVLLLVGLASAMLPTATARAPNVVDAVNWGAVGTPVQASPGDNGKLLSVTIRNSDTSAYTNVKAQLGAGSGITPAPGGGTSALSGAFAAGDTFVAKFYVNVDPAAPVGAFLSLPLTVTMTYRGTDATVRDDLGVNIQLTGHPALEVSTNPATLPVGEEKDVTIKVTNAGDGAASNVRLTLTPAQGSGLTLVRTDNVRNLGALAAGESKTTTVRMRAATSGSPSVSAALAYDDAAGNGASEARTLYFDTTNVSDAPLTSEVVSHTVTKGENGEVTVRVRNAASSEVRDVSVVLEPAPGSGLALADQAAPATAVTLAPGATLDLTTRFLSTSAQTDVASVVATVTWSTTDGTSHSRAYQHGIRLWNAERAAVSVRLLEDHLDSGRSGTLSFVIANNQTTALRGVTASLQPPSATTVAYTVRDATDSQRLGAIASGASATMVTNVITSNSATGLQRILLDVSWQDADGTPRTQTYDFGIAILGTVDFQVGTSTGSFDPASGAGSVSATVTNLGNAIAHNVYVSLQATSAYAGTQETYLGDINPNTANPFTLQTTLLNLTLLNASAPVGAPTGAPSGGFGGAGRAGVPGQGGRPGGQAANASDTGGFGGRNGTRGIFPAPGGAVVVVRWNDEYGTSHSAIYNLTLRPRAASAAAGAAAATSSASGISKYVPAPTFALVAIALGCAAVAWRRKER